MKQLHNKVNIVPVIAKADVLTKKEVLHLKKRVMEEIEGSGIKIYPLPDCDSDEDEDYKEQVRQLKEAVPFAVCGANTLLEVKGKRVRGRLYPWGVVEVENPDHCDFIKLRTMLMYVIVLLDCYNQTLRHVPHIQTQYFSFLLITVHTCKIYRK